MSDVPVSIAAVMEVPEIMLPSTAIPSLLTLQYPFDETGT